MFTCKLAQENFQWNTRPAPLFLRRLRFKHVNKTTVLQDWQPQTVHVIALKMISLSYPRLVQFELGDAPEHIGTIAHRIKLQLPTVRRTRRMHARLCKIAIDSDDCNTVCDQRIGGGIPRHYIVIPALESSRSTRHYSIYFCPLRCFANWRKEARQRGSSAILLWTIPPISW